MIAMVCDDCGEIFQVDEDQIRLYEAKLKYAKSIENSASAVSIDNMQFLFDNSTYANMQRFKNDAEINNLRSQSELIKNSAINPRKCPKCGSKLCHEMTQYEIYSYNQKIKKQQEKKKKELEKALLEQQEKEKEERIRKEEEERIRKEEERIRKIEERIRKEKEEKRQQAFSTPINPNATKEELVKRIVNFINDKEWDMAEHYLEHTLDMDPENYYLYYLKFLIINQCRNNKDLLSKNIGFDKKDKIAAKIYKYADETFELEMENHNLKIPKKIAKIDFLKKDIANIFCDKKKYCLLLETDDKLKKEIIEGIYKRFKEHIDIEDLKEIFKSINAIDDIFKNEKDVIVDKIVENIKEDLISFKVKDCNYYNEFIKTLNKNYLDKKNTDILVDAILDNIKSNIKNFNEKDIYKYLIPLLNSIHNNKTDSIINEFNEIKKKNEEKRIKDFLSDKEKVINNLEDKRKKYNKISDWNYILKEYEKIKSDIVTFKTKLSMEEETKDGLEPLNKKVEERINEIKKEKIKKTIKEFITEKEKLLKGIEDEVQYSNNKEKYWEYVLNEYKIIKNKIIKFNIDYGLEEIKNEDLEIFNNKIEKKINEISNVIKENKKIEEEKKKIKEKRKKVIIALSILIFVLLGLIFGVIMPSVKYNKAVSLYNDKQYDAANKMFKELGNYKNSKDWQLDCQYCKAVELYNDDRYDESYNIFDELGEYKNSKELKLDCKYCKAIKLYNDKQYEEAYKIFSEIRYKDSMVYMVKIVADSLKLAKDVNNKNDLQSIKFGKWQGQEIEWIALDRKDGKVLLTTKHNIAVRKYNEKRRNITWEECSLRQWLNNTFYNESFNNEEMNSIVETLVINNDNSIYGTDGGTNTNDKVFLLSIDEINKYFNNDDVRATGEDYWLRSPASTQDHAAEVFSSGCVSAAFGINVGYSANGIRPALWVKYK